MLNSIDRVGRALAVVEYERQPLHVIQKLRAKIPNQFFARVGLQIPGGEALSADCQRDSKQHRNRGFERSATRM